MTPQASVHELIQLFTKHYTNGENTHVLGISVPLHEL